MFSPYFKPFCQICSFLGCLGKFFNPITAALAQQDSPERLSLRGETHPIESLR